MQATSMPGMDVERSLQMSQILAAIDYLLSNIPGVGHISKDGRSHGT